MRILGSLSWTCNSRRFNFLNGLISLDDTMKRSATFALLYSWVNQKLHGIPVLNLSQKPFNYSTEPSLSLLYRRLSPLPLFILDPFTCWNSIEAILDSTHTHIILCLIVAGVDTAGETWGQVSASDAWELPVLLESSAHLPFFLLFCNSKIWLKYSGFPIYCTGMQTLPICKLVIFELPMSSPIMFQTCPIE